ncbi:uncharacterized protein BDR25DRAFT_355885 [Lindgomyces ingoldianus]|uniref:Uncharacterized protein n=1 Tax=Lindgomyces ingoldianus TaxID=673940 RepID=A0ACB6QVG5_9PLEO|nr:uncharacterized protein BDR25DRAFT_355885 [Lindgomyces ingoldianus]KAF2470181.1 hypothetical protein BDR25DRAFT_355885 [Lindgomyces ingoldianus]
MQPEFNSPSETCGPAFPKFPLPAYTPTYMSSTNPSNASSIGNHLTEYPSQYVPLTGHFLDKTQVASCHAASAGAQLGIRIRVSVLVEVVAIILWQNTARRDGMAKGGLIQAVGEVKVSRVDFVHLERGKRATGVSERLEVLLKLHINTTLFHCIATKLAELYSTKSNQEVNFSANNRKWPALSPAHQEPVKVLHQKLKSNTSLIPHPSPFISTPTRILPPIPDINTPSSPP